MSVSKVLTELLAEDSRTENGQNDIVARLKKANTWMLLQSRKANPRQKPNIVLCYSYVSFSQSTIKHVMPPTFFVFFLPWKYICYYSGQGYKTGHPTKQNKTSSCPRIQGYYGFRVRYKQYLKKVWWDGGLYSHLTSNNSWKKRKWLRASKRERERAKRESLDMIET